MPKASQVLYQKPAEPMVYDEEAMKRLRAASQFIGAGVPAKRTTPRPAKPVAYVMGAKRG